jgi:hypothetical protein
MQGSPINAPETGRDSTLTGHNPAKGKWADKILDVSAIQGRAQKGTFIANKMPHVIQSIPSSRLNTVIFWLLASILYS